MSPSYTRTYQKRTRLTKLQGLRICDRHCDFPGSTYAELASWAKAEFALVALPSRPMICRVLKTEAALRQLTVDCLDRQRRRPSFQLRLDQAIIEFVAACESWQVALSGSMIIAQAKKTLARLHTPPHAWPKLGWSWLRPLQVRYGISWHRAYSESGQVDLGAVEDEVRAVRSLIRSYSYEDVFNMDETSFFFNCVPRGSLCLHAAPALKQDKAQLTPAVCTNATGTDKLPLLFFGKAFKPRWLKQKPADALYASTPRAWMTTELYQGWLRDVDKSMREQGRHILLLVDNASSQCDEDLTLTNVRVAKLPPNTTSKLQPLDQGIIYCVKRRVLRKKMEHALERIDEGDANPYKVGMLQAINWCVEAWYELPAETIKHCWLHSTLIAKTDMNYILA